VLATLSTEQIEGLGSDQVGALTSAQVNALSTTQVAALTTEDFAALSTTQVAAFSSAQITAIQTEDLVQLGSDDIKALTTSQIDGLTTDQIVAITTDQIVGLETADIASMSMDQVLAFTTDQTTAMTTDQTNALFLASPIMLDLDGDGVRTVSAADGVSFDLFGDGKSAQWGWAAGGDGFLVMDLNGDGQINDGRELFGQGTRLADGSRAADGYVALAAQDSDRDGDVDAGDANFGQLKVWVDADGDGLTDAGELKTLTELGISSLSTGHVKDGEIDNGNVIGLSGHYTKADGSTAAMADVWFAKDATPPSSAEVLAPASAAVPLPGQAAGESLPAVAPEALILPVKRLDDDDLLNKLPPLL
jgi:hypothetical protein